MSKNDEKNTLSLKAVVERNGEQINKKDYEMVCLQFNMSNV